MTDPNKVKKLINSFNFQSPSSPPSSSYRSSISSKSYKYNIKQQQSSTGHTAKPPPPPWANQVFINLGIH